MFASDQPLIARHAETPQGFADVVTFAIATQNQHFYAVGKILDSLRADGLEACRFLNSNQKRGIAYVTACAEGIKSNVWYRGDAVSAICALVEIPNIGIVKAGFIWQMIAGQGGCLDRHNLQVAGLSLKAFSRVPQSTESLRQRVETYLQLCAILGNPEALWDGWCRLIYLKYPQHFKDAQEVSRKHVEWCRVESALSATSTDGKWTFPARPWVVKETTT